MIHRGQGQTHLGTVADLNLKNSGASGHTLLSGQAAQVTHKHVNSYSEASAPTPCETI